MRILFLCTGNIHRSALAEAMLREAIARDGRSDLEVSSAGTLHVQGLPAAPEAAQLAREAGLDLSGHRSRPADAAILEASDLIVVMESEHREWVAARDPAAAARCRMLSDHAGPDAAIAPGEDVPDAIGEEIDSFRRTFGILRSCVAGLYRDLPPPPEEVYTRAIEERFRLRRRSALTIASADYDLMDRWWRRGVPLWLILETIDHLLARQQRAGDAARVRRLAYVESEVEHRFASLQRRQVAADQGERTPPEGGPSLLARAVERLRSAAAAARARGEAPIADLIEEAAGGLEAPGAGREADASAARLRLHATDAALIEALRAATAPDDLRAFRAEAEAALAEHRSRMSVAGFEATVERAVGRRLRERHQAPDLTEL